MAHKQKPKQQPAAACSIRWRYLYRSNSREVELPPAGVHNRFSHLSQLDNSQTICRGRKKACCGGILYRYSLGVIMNWIKWKFKLLWQRLKPTSMYVYVRYDDFSDCYTASFMAELHRRTKI